MAKLKSETKITCSITIELSEVEARALDAVLGYNVDAFLKTFYKEMGEHYLKPHEEGLRMLHKTLPSILRGELHNVTMARNALKTGKEKG
jgi:hypothetical protein